MSLVFTRPLKILSQIFKNESITNNGSDSDLYVFFFFVVEQT